MRREIAAQLAPLAVKVRPGPSDQKVREVSKANKAQGERGERGGYRGNPESPDTSPQPRMAPSSRGQREIQ